MRGLAKAENIVGKRIKKVIPILFFLMGSCASVETYKVGEYSVYVASKTTVNEEYQKVCVFNCSRTVKGFVNYNKKEMWTVASTEVIMHEIKHIVEGHFHPKPIRTE